MVAGQTWSAMQTFTDVLALRPATTFSTSTSTGGVVNIDNTASTGAGQVIYSNAGADAAGRLLNVRADNAQFPAAAVHVDYNGAGNAVEIVNSGTGSPSVALNVVSSNPRRADSASATARRRRRSPARSSARSRCSTATARRWGTSRSTGRWAEGCRSAS